MNTVVYNKNNDFKVNIYKSVLIKLYNFAYNQAKITGKLNELQEIDLLINSDYEYNKNISWEMN